MPPRAVACSLCGQMFFPASLKFHQKTCKEKQERAAIDCPYCAAGLTGATIDAHISKCKAARAAVPNAPSAAFGATSDGGGLAAPQRLPDGRVQCQFCGRGFAADRVHKHTAICGQLKQARPRAPDGSATQLPEKVFRTAAIDGLIVDARPLSSQPVPQPVMPRQRLDPPTPAAPAPDALQVAAPSVADPHSAPAASPGPKRRVPSRSASRDAQTRPPPLQSRSPPRPLGPPRPPPRQARSPTRGPSEASLLGDGAEGDWRAKHQEFLDAIRIARRSAQQGGECAAAESAETPAMAKATTTSTSASTSTPPSAAAPGASPPLPSPQRSGTGTAPGSGPGPGSGAAAAASQPQPQAPRAKATSVMRRASAPILAPAERAEAAAAAATAVIGGASSQARRRSAPMTHRVLGSAEREAGASQEEWTLGSRIRVHGLMSTAHLNGQDAELISYDSDAGCWLARLANGEMKALRPEHLAASSSAAATPLLAPRGTEAAKPQTSAIVPVAGAATQRLSSAVGSGESGKSLVATGPTVRSRPPSATRSPVARQVSKGSSSGKSHSLGARRPRLGAKQAEDVAEFALPPKGVRPTPRSCRSSSLAVVREVDRGADSPPSCLADPVRLVEGLGRVSEITAGQVLSPREREGTEPPPAKLRPPGTLDNATLSKLDHDLQSRIPRPAGLPQSVSIPTGRRYSDNDLGSLEAMPAGITCAGGHSIASLGGKSAEDPIASPRPYSCQPHSHRGRAEDAVSARSSSVQGEADEGRGAWQESQPELAAELLMSEAANGTRSSSNTSLPSGRGQHPASASTCDAAAGLVHATASAAPSFFGTGLVTGNFTPTTARSALIPSLITPTAAQYRLATPPSQIRLLSSTQLMHSHSQGAGKVQILTSAPRASATHLGAVLRPRPLCAASPFLTPFGVAVALAPAPLAREGRPEARRLEAWQTGGGTPSQPRFNTAVLAPHPPASLQLSSALGASPPQVAVHRQASAVALVGVTLAPRVLR